MKWRDCHSRRREFLCLHSQRRFIAAAFAVLAGLAPGACSSPPHPASAAAPLPIAPVQAEAAALTNPAPTSLADRQTWSVVAGETVADTLRRWSRQAGYTPAPHFTARESWHFIVTEDYQGNFEQALQWLSSGFSRYDRKPMIELHANHTLDLLSMPGDGMAGEGID